jgi:hypothetical protein
VKGTKEGHISINIFDTVIDSHGTRPKGLCHRCESASDQTNHSDEICDMMISVEVSSSSDTTPKALPKALKLSRNQCQKLKKVPRPTRV